MRSVLIVDDEYYAREGIKKIINSFSEDFYIIGEADNSFLALNLIRQKRPDIVLTDINMPVMDGIELVRTASEFASNSKFIIITGYDKFEYAKKAFKLDIVDFILKPVDKEELYNAITKASSYIVRDVNAIKREMISYLRKSSDNKEAFEYYSWNKFRLSLIQFNRELKVQNREDDFKKLFETIVSNYFKDSFCILEMHSDRLVLLNNGEDDFNLFLKYLELQSFLYESENEKMLFSMTISNPCEIYELRESYIYAKMLMFDVFYYGEGVFIKEIYPTLKTFDIELLNELLKDIQISVKAFDRKKTLLKIDSLYKNLFEIKSSIEIAVEYSMRIYLSVKNIVENEQLNFEELKKYNPVSHSITLSKLWSNSREYVKLSLSLLRDDKSENEENSIKKAISIINQKFCQDISLETIAKEVYLNPSYLSRKLKENLGISFLRYLTKLRMEKAIELLDENNNIEEVANKVGFSSYRSFSEAFKQYTGYLPSKYKSKIMTTS